MHKLLKDKTRDKRLWLLLKIDDNMYVTVYLYALRSNLNLVKKNRLEAQNVKESILLTKTISIRIQLLIPACTLATASERIT